MSVLKPVMYLDVDGVLLRLSETREEHLKRLAEEPRLYKGYAASGAKEFLLWADKHYEIRWLTYWAMQGTMREKNAEYLSLAIGLEKEFFMNIVNPRSWYHHKTEAIDFKDPRPFLWIEDGILDEEQEIMDSARPDQVYMYVNTQQHAEWLHAVMDV